MTRDDKPTVLVADDNPDDREITKRLLELCCVCRVVEAEDGLDAVGLALSERPDMILMDLRMPGLDGYEAAARIRQNPALQSVPMIAYSAYYSFTMADEALEAGFDEYVRKPVTEEEMKELVSRFLNVQ
jgi:two-component system cell cycle response regulator DivK